MADPITTNATTGFTIDLDPADMWKGRALQAERICERLEARELVFQSEITRLRRAMLNASKGMHAALDKHTEDAMERAHGKR